MFANVRHFLILNDKDATRLTGALQLQRGGVSHAPGDDDIDAVQIIQHQGQVFHQPLLLGTVLMVGHVLK